MSDHENEPSGHLSRWLIAVVLVFVVYPLSVFPVAFISGATTGRRPGGLVFNVLYEPLELIAEGVPTIGRPLGDYFDACFEEGRTLHRRPATASK
jgi:hypothetical protein